MSDHWPYMEDNEPATEADRVRWLGLSFRSKSHRHHFRASILLVCAVLGMAIVLPAVAAPFAMPCVMAHGSIMLTALEQTRWGRVNGKRFSRDCIWFNGLMAIVYAVITVVAFHLAHGMRLPH